MSRDDLTRELHNLKNRYDPLVCIAGSAGSGKHQLIQDLASAFRQRVSNLNTLLAEALLPLKPEERPRSVKPWLEKYLSPGSEAPCFFDPCEILWASELQIQPLVLLHQLSQVRPLVTTLAGEVRGRELIIARPGHTEYGVQKLAKLVLVKMPEEEITYL
ncbi:MAG: hypothetical protein CVV27_02005 [Candidatus Melainabacteria bacterium HGW-Melainabacteria-1]|nr:MAG: hypothetical protein CVV27_02005 [Candidatus Melainabacteria bacterium HGW-Melainabacteria-1]